jgi:hypothetical protein
VAGIFYWAAHCIAQGKQEGRSENFTLWEVLFHSGKSLPAGYWLYPVIGQEPDRATVIVKLINYFSEGSHHEKAY